jgi:hypothetical protein
MSTANDESEPAVFDPIFIQYIIIMYDYIDGCCARTLHHIYSVFFYSQAQALQLNVCFDLLACVFNEPKPADQRTRVRCVQMQQEEVHCGRSPLAMGRKST